MCIEKKNKDSMGIRRKFSIVVGPLMLGLALLVYSVISERFLRQFSVIESDFAERNVDRALDAVDGVLEEVNTKLTDWAQWDDTYVFVQDHNQEYWQSNLSNDAVVEGMKLHMMAFVDRSGNIVASKNIVDNDSSSDELPQDVREEILSGRFINYNDGAAFHKGIISNGEQAFFVASRPIIRTDGSGPAAGTAVFVRVFDDALVREVSGRVRLPIHLYHSVESLPLDDRMKGEFTASLENEKDDMVNIEGDKVAGYGAIHDVFGAHGLFLRIEMPRTIYEYGQGVIRFFHIFLGSVFVAFFLLLMFLLEMLVFKPISRLSADVDHIRTSGDEVSRIQTKGNDQIARLGSNINRMLESLHVMRTEKGKRDSDRLRETEALNRMMVSRELKMVELKKELQRLRKQCGEL